MTNEEKILDLLAGMSLRFDTVDAKLDSMDNRLIKTEFKIETEMDVKLDALAEGHAAIIERLVPTSRVKFLESMLRSMNDELQRLKRAQ